MGRDFVLDRQSYISGYLGVSLSFILKLMTVTFIEPFDAPISNYFSCTELCLFTSSISFSHNNILHSFCRWENQRYERLSKVSRFDNLRTVELWFNLGFESMQSTLLFCSPQAVKGTLKTSITGLGKSRWIWALTPQPFFYGRLHPSCFFMRNSHN